MLRSEADIYICEDIYSSGVEVGEGQSSSRSPAM